MAISRSGPVTRDSSTVALGLAKVLVGEADANIASITQVLDQTVNSLGALNASNFTSNVEYWKLESGYPLLEDLTIPLREAVSLGCEFKEIKPGNLAIARGIDPAGGDAASWAYQDMTSGAGGVESDPATATIVVFDATTISDVWTVVFDTTTTYKVFGLQSGHVQTAGAQDGSISADRTFQVSGSDCFTIEANYFDANWVIDDTYHFVTTAQGDFTNSHSGEIALGNIEAPDYVRVEAIYTYPNGQNHMYIILPRANVTSSVELAFAMEDNANVAVTCEAKRADSGVTGITTTVWDNMPLGRIYFD